MKSLISILIVALMTLSLAACNTTRGVGQDIEALGENIEDAADKD